MVDRWPEGPAADPEAARERYDSDMRASRKAMRETVRADLHAAHLGLGLVVVARVIVGLLAGPVAGPISAPSAGAPTSLPEGAERQAYVKSFVRRPSPAAGLLPERLDRVGTGAEFGGSDRARGDGIGMVKEFRQRLCHNRGR